MLDFLALLFNSLIINPMINSLLFLYSLLGGQFWLAIILFTVLVKIITFPLNWQQIKSSRAMMDLQHSKAWQDMQKKYAKDKEKLAQATMAIYKEKGVSPFGSCLPTLIQFPVLIGLYQSITRVLTPAPLQLLDLTGLIYPFLSNVEKLIPVNPHFLWMNLGQPERLLIPGLAFGIPTLAILVVLSTYIQQKLIVMPGADASQAQMTQMMNLYMPLMFGYFVMSYSSGLGLYFFISNLLTIAQYALTGQVDWKNVLTLPSFGRTAAPARSSKK